MTTACRWLSELFAVLGGSTERKCRYFMDVRRRPLHHIMFACSSILRQHNSFISFFNLFVYIVMYVMYL